MDKPQYIPSRIHAKENQGRVHSLSGSQTVTLHDKGQMERKRRLTVKSTGRHPESVNAAVPASRSVWPGEMAGGWTQGDLGGGHVPDLD